MLHQTLGENIRLYRRRAKMTNKELAEKVGVSMVTISNYESDNTVPNITNLIKLSQSLGVSVDDLLSLSNRND